MDYNFIQLKPTAIEPDKIIVEVIQYSLIFIGLLAVGFAIYGGVLYITSGGDSEKTTKARNTLLYAVLGVILVVLAYAIISWASNFAFEGPTTV